MEWAGRPVRASGPGERKKEDGPGKEEGEPRRERRKRERERELGWARERGKREIEPKRLF